MKYYLPFAIIIFSLFLVGCSKHQFVYVEGQPDNLYSNENKIENDTLEIFYNFSGNNIPVNIRVRNKSDKPIYIDWKKSAAIIDGKKYSYWEDVSTIGVSGSTIRLSSTNLSFFDGNGEVVKDERISYIPPHSYIETTRILLQTTLFGNLPLDQRQRLRMASENGPIHVKRYSFSEDNTPLFFRSILTLSSKESFNNESLFEKTFWVSEIIESPVKILSAHQRNQESGIRGISNTSTITKMSSFGVAAGAVSLLGVTTGLLLLTSEGNGE